MQSPQPVLVPVAMIAAGWVLMQVPKCDMGSRTVAENLINHGMQRLLG